MFEKLLSLLFPPRLPRIIERREVSVICDDVPESGCRVIHRQGYRDAIERHWAEEA